MGEIERRQALYILDVLNTLSTDRAIGFVVGPIPFSSMLRFAQWEGLDRDATMLLVDVIQMLDADRIDRAESKRMLES